MINEEFVSGLIEMKDPLPLIWQRLKEMWNFSKVTKNDISNFYTNSEKETSEFEEAIFKIFFEIYDILLARKNESLLKDILRKNNYAVTILDGMSIRESNFFLSKLKRQFEVKNYTYTLSSVPTVTGAFCKNVLGYTHPSQILGKKKLDFIFSYVDKETDIKPLKGEKILVWTSYPDGLLHARQKGRIAVLSISDIVTRTWNILSKILENIDADDIIVTSDHGYVYLTAESWWPVGKDNELLLKKTFGMERSKTISEVSSNLIGKFKEKSPEKREVIFDKEVIAAKGRFSWSVPGRAIPVRHGGISFMESIIPFIQLTRK